MILQFVLGVSAALAVFVFAGGIAEKIFGIQYSSMIIMILAPAIFLRSVSAVLQGYTGGRGAELPAAAAGILRQAFTLGFSVMFCRMLREYGDKVSRLLVQENYAYMYAGVGVALAITLSEIFVVLFLGVICKFFVRSSGKTQQEGMRTIVSFADSVRLLCGSRGTQMGIELLALLFLPVGLIFLQKAALGNEQVLEAYGVYVAGYGLVCGCIVAVMLILMIPVCGKTFSLIRKEEHRFARSVFQGGVHIIFVHTVFFAVFLGVMAEQAAAVLCPLQAMAAAQMFRGGSTIIVFAALSFYFSKILLFPGKKYLTFAMFAVADVVYMVAVAVLLNTGAAEVSDLVYAGVIAGAVLCVGLGALAYIQFGQKADLLRILVIPSAVACVTGIVGLLLAKVLTPHLGNGVSLFICFVLCAALYWAGLLLLRNFSEQELESIPGGKLINAMGQFLHVL